VAEPETQGAGERALSKLWADSEAAEGETTVMRVSVAAQVKRKVPVSQALSGEQRGSGGQPRLMSLLSLHVTCQW
jgi:hypothetical protein